MGATACIITAHFAAFTYIEPLLINLQGVPATALSGLLLLSGVSGLLGNVIAGKLIDRHLKGLIFAALLLSGGRAGAPWRRPSCATAVLF
ncbi:putative integral membrane transport protein [Klebsiella pneumoniae]|nr:putative integral membrane transport protein [Klebsiella pneumoniae]